MTFEGNKTNGKHYWLTPPELMARMRAEFPFDYDACPHPCPPDFDGTVSEWGSCTYVNPPFKGPTAWVRKALLEHNKGKTVVLVFPIDKWLVSLLTAPGVEIRNLGDVRWLSTEDGEPGPGIGRYTAQFILRGRKGGDFLGFASGSRMRSESESFPRDLKGAAHPSNAVDESQEGKATK